MVKAPITKGVINEMSSRFDLFAKEPVVYLELLPKLKLKIPHDFAPKCYPCPIKGLVLKDLKEDGFVMCERLNQLGVSHCKLALTSLAKFHAGSVACYKEDPDFVTSIGKELFYANEDTLGELSVWFKTAIGAVGTMLKDIEGFQHTAEHFLKRSETIVDSLIDTCKPREGSLNVLNHGDFWMNNMLFKHDDEGRVVDVKFVDFQVVRYASPALDLLYFLYTSADEEARAQKTDLLEAYLESLNSCLESLDCDERLTLEQLEEDMTRCGDWVIVSICNVLPIVLCDPENVLNMEDYSEDDFKEAKIDDSYLKIFTSKGYTAKLPKVVMSFNEQFLKED